jgi:hypothetical protein
MEGSKYQGLKAVSCKSAFPKALIAKAKELAQQGFQFSQEGKVAASKLWPEGMAAILCWRLGRKWPMARHLPHGRFTRRSRECE